VKLLVVEGIPQLDSSKFNEAKRFVTLIDALYEGHVRLICSAEAEPEKLYLEGAGSFEFERTASRLREMQGADGARGGSPRARGNSKHPSPTVVGRLAGAFADPPLRPFGRSKKNSETGR
jgi:hypothetical protein